VEIEAVEVRVPRRRREPPRRVGIPANTPHARPRAGTERNAALDRGAADAGQSRRFLDHRVGPEYVGVTRVEPSTAEQTPHARRDPREHDTNLLVRRRWQRVEIECAGPAIAEEDAVEHERVEVDVEQESVMTP
jgi:hypothetical protein